FSKPPKANQLITPKGTVIVNKIMLQTGGWSNINSKLTMADQIIEVAIATPIFRRCQFLSAVRQLLQCLVWEW
ncbi:hypothetical protein, partial [Crocosphaera watsonii]